MLKTQLCFVLQVCHCNHSGACISLLFVVACPKLTWRPGYCDSCIMVHCSVRCAFRRRQAFCQVVYTAMRAQHLPQCMPANTGIVQLQQIMHCKSTTVQSNSHGLQESDRETQELLHQLKTATAERNNLQAAAEAATARQQEHEQLVSDLTHAVQQQKAHLQVRVHAKFVRKENMCPHVQARVEVLSPALISSTLSWAHCSASAESIPPSTKSSLLLLLCCFSGTATPGIAV